MNNEVERENAPARRLVGYTEPIARSGEQQFACILRNRSGCSSGEIDFGARFIDELSPSEQQDAIEAAYSVYLKWCRETGLTSKRTQAQPADDLAEALVEVTASLEWNAHGICRGINDGPIMPSSMAVGFAKEALATYRAAQEKKDDYIQI